MKKDSIVPKLVRILKKLYPANEFAVHHNTPYKVLIACILSLRTKDEVTYPAARRLFALAETPQAMLQIKDNLIQKTIYPVGFYKRKTKTIKHISQEILNRYFGEVPSEIDELLTLKGVGRKTANIVVTFGYKKPGIAVDTHVHRIMNRMGIVKTQYPEETEFALRAKVPKKYWIEINELMVRHGQRTCKPISPLCSVCPVVHLCRRVGVGKSR